MPRRTHILKEEVFAPVVGESCKVQIDMLGCFFFFFFFSGLLVSVSALVTKLHVF